MMEWHSEGFGSGESLSSHVHGPFPMRKTLPSKNVKKNKPFPSSLISPMVVWKRCKPKKNVFFNTSIISAGQFHQARPNSTKQRMCARSSPLMALHTWSFTFCVSTCRSERKSWRIRVSWEGFFSDYPKDMFWEIIFWIFNIVYIKIYEMYE